MTDSAIDRTKHAEISQEQAVVALANGTASGAVKVKSAKDCLTLLCLWLTILVEKDAKKLQMNAEGYAAKVNSEVKEAGFLISET